MATLISTPK